MKLLSALFLLNGISGQVMPMGGADMTGIERRPNAMSFTSSRDHFQVHGDDNRGEPTLSVDDLDLSKRLKPNLRCLDRIVPGSLSDDNSRIVGGYQAERDAWPFIVKIRIGCGGTIVSNNWVVTAAHCCRVSNHRFLDVTVGEFDRGSNDVGARTIQIIGKVLHPSFIPSTLRNDICLLKLESSIVFSNFAQPACLPKPGTRIDHHQLQKDGGNPPLCYVAGWGRIGETLGTARILQETQVPIVNNTVCDKAYARNNVRENEMMCAGYAEGGIDACQGDSGGPLICVENDQPVLRGVVSWGIGCARRGLYGVYTRTSSYTDWVRSVVNPDNLDAGEIATTKATTTTKVTTTTTTVPEESSSTRCGSEKVMRKKFRVADNVTIGCKNMVCHFRCPADHVATASKVTCKQRGKKAAFVPKKIKKGVHCKFTGKPTPPPTTPPPTAAGGFNTGDSAASEAINQAQASNLGTGSTSGGFGQANPKTQTKCGNVEKSFRINTDLIDIDCNRAAPNMDVCVLKCMNGAPEDPSMWTDPTLKSIRCKGKKADSKKWKFAPKKAKIACKNGQKIDDRAEATCGYLPVKIDAPANYFCEGYNCHFYCDDANQTPNKDIITCNPAKKTWWPRKFTVFCQ